MFDQTQIRAFKKLFKWIEKSFSPKFKYVFFDVLNDKVVITDSMIYLEINKPNLGESIGISENLLLPLQYIKQAGWLDLIQINTYINKLHLNKAEDLEKHEIDFLMIIYWNNHFIFDDFEYGNDIEYIWYQGFVDWVQNSRQSSLFEQKTIVYNNQDCINRFHEWLNILASGLEIELSKWYLVAEFMYGNMQHRVITRSGVLATDNK